MLDAPAPVHLHYATEGSGPPMVLLHGFPQTRLAWAPVADRLAPTFTVVRPDLRGYGESPKPPTGYSKRAMAEDVLALMRGLGHERFAVAGPDRGGLVGQRLGVDPKDVRQPGPPWRLKVLEAIS